MSGGYAWRGRSPDGRNGQLWRTGGRTRNSGAWPPNRTPGCYWQGHGHESLMCVGVLTDLVNATARLTRPPTRFALSSGGAAAVGSRHTLVRTRRVLYTYGGRASTPRSNGFIRPLLSVLLACSDDGFAGVWSPKPGHTITRRETRIHVRRDQAHTVTDSHTAHR